MENRHYISEDKEEYTVLPEKEWRVIRKECFARDHYTCQRCDKKAPNGHGIAPHHIIPREEGGSFHGTNLITLCTRCHDYVEVKGYRTRVEIVTTDDPIPFLDDETEEEFVSDIDENRPEWHGWVYGSKMRSTQYYITKKKNR